MKILLDAMMPGEILSHLVGHEVSHSTSQGWQELSNGKLLTAAEAGGFDVLLTKDSNMPYQQNMVGRKIRLVVVKPRSQDIDDLLELAPGVLQVLEKAEPGSVHRVLPG